MSLIFSREYVNIRYDQRRRMLLLEWFGHVSTPDFISVMDFVKAECTELQCDFILIDTSKQGALQKESTDYASITTVEFLKRGVKAILFVMPQSLYTRMSLDMYKDETETNKVDEKIRFFVSVEDALGSIGQ